MSDNPALYPIFVTKNTVLLLKRLMIDLEVEDGRPLDDVIVPALRLYRSSLDACNRGSAIVSVPLTSVFGFRTPCVKA